MTIEEIKDIIRYVFQFYVENTETYCWSEINYACEEALMALDVVPFMNKPCVANKVCHEDKVEVLNKVKSDIEKLPKTYPFTNHFHTYVKEDDVRNIIDKYKEESSDHNQYAKGYKDGKNDAINKLMPYGRKCGTKIGHWVRWYEQKDNGRFVENIPHCKCSECDTEYDPHSTKFIKYCSECGAMILSNL